MNTRKCLNETRYKNLNKLSKLHCFLSEINYTNTNMGIVKTAADSFHIKFTLNWQRCKETFILQMLFKASWNLFDNFLFLGMNVSTHGNNQTVISPPPPTPPASAGQCIICVERTIDSVLYQCGHMCVCNYCGLQLKMNGNHCPMCRAPIRDVIRAYQAQSDLWSAKSVGL